MERKNVNIYLTTAILAAILMFSVTIQSRIPINSSEYKTSQVSTTIYVDPLTLAEPSSANFAVGISIENVTDLCAWQARLKWDPQVLDVVDVTEGDFLETGESTPSYFSLNQSEGWIFVCDINLRPPTGVNGSGTLAKVTFRGASPGECVLDLYDTKLFNRKPVEVPTPPYLGDADGDLEVTSIDGGMVTKALWTSEGDPGYKPNADFNKDGFVDFFDFLCYPFNFGKRYPERNASKPVEIAHEAHDGYITISPPYSVAWKWLDYPYHNPVWLTANVTVSGSYPIENFSFNRSLGQISFNFTSATSGFCNVTIPKLLMDGGFKVLINDTQVASILTWNMTHTFVYFTHDQGTHNVTIIGEIVTRIRSVDLLYLVDVNADGIVDVIDLATVSKRYNWEEDR